MITISAVFPAYQDQHTLPGVVRSVEPILAEHTSDYEIIIVNDGSTDATGQIANQLAVGNQRITVVHHPKNLGYGSALRTGFARCSKEFVFYTDSDAQYDVRELAQLVRFTHQYDVVNGYKAARRDRWHRRWIGNLYCTLMRTIFRIKIRDITCDFRLMSRSYVQGINLASNSGFVCVELVKKLQDGGARFKEVPVSHHSRTYGRSQAFKPRQIAAMVRDFWRFVVGKSLFRLRSPHSTRSFDYAQDDVAGRPKPKVSSKPSS